MHNNCTLKYTMQHTIVNQSVVNPKQKTKTI